MKSNRIQIIPVHCLWSSVTWMLECVRWFVSTVERGPTKRNLDYRSQSSQLHVFISFHLILRFIRIWSFVFDLIKKKKTIVFSLIKDWISLRWILLCFRMISFEMQFFFRSILWETTLLKSARSLSTRVSVKLQLLKFNGKYSNLNSIDAKTVRRKRENTKPKRCECIKGRKEIHILLGNYSER